MLVSSLSPFRKSLRISNVRLLLPCVPLLIMTRVHLFQWCDFILDCHCCVFFLHCYLLHRYRPLHSLVDFMKISYPIIAVDLFQYLSVIESLPFFVIAVWFLSAHHIIVFHVFCCHRVVSLLGQTYFPHIKVFRIDALTFFLKFFLEIIFHDTDSLFNVLFQSFNTNIFSLFASTIAFPWCRSSVFN